MIDRPRNAHNLADNLIVLFNENRNIILQQSNRQYDGNIALTLWKLKQAPVSIPISIETLTQRAHYATDFSNLLIKIANLNPWVPEKLETFLQHDEQNIVCISRISEQLQSVNLWNQENYEKLELYLKECSHGLRFITQIIERLKTNNAFDQSTYDSLLNPLNNDNKEILIKLADVLELALPAEDHEEIFVSQLQHIVMQLTYFYGHIYDVFDEDNSEHILALASNYVCQAGQLTVFLGTTIEILNQLSTHLNDKKEKRVCFTTTLTQLITFMSHVTTTHTEASTAKTEEEQIEEILFYLSINVQSQSLDQWMETLSTLASSPEQFEETRRALVESYKQRAENFNFFSQEKTSGTPQLRPRDPGEVSTIYPRFGS